LIADRHINNPVRLTCTGMYWKGLKLVAVLNTNLQVPLMSAAGFTAGIKCTGSKEESTSGATSVLISYLA
jgi:hypothetical protein